MNPEDVFEDYVWGTLLDDYDRIAANIAPGELRLFQEQVFEGLSVATPAQLKRHVQSAFGDGMTRGRLRGMTPHQIFVTFLKARAADFRNEEGKAVLEPPAIVSCEKTDDIATIEWTAMIAISGEPTLLEKRVGLRRIDGRWWVLLDERMANLGTLIRESLKDE